jgi:hypothetical protein
MEGERIHVIEVCTGVVLIVIGFILYWWSTQLLWILIHPPPLTKQFLDSLPFVFWIIGALFVVDGLRRMMMRKAS